MHLSRKRPFETACTSLNAAPGIKVFLLLFLQKKKICSFLKKRTKKLLRLAQFHNASQAITFIAHTGDIALKHSKSERLYVSASSYAVPWVNTGEAAQETKVLLRLFVRLDGVR